MPPRSPVKPPSAKNRPRVRLYAEFCVLVARRTLFKCS